MRSHFAHTLTAAPATEPKVNLVHLGPQSNNRIWEMRFAQLLVYMAMTTNGLTRALAVPEKQHTLAYMDPNPHSSSVSYANADQEIATEPPAYPLGTGGGGSTDTPMIDAFLADNKAVERASQGLRDALLESDWKCATKRVVRALTTLVFEIKRAYKNNHLTRADKKALKREAKGVAKDCWREIKAAWTAAAAE